MAVRQQRIALPPQNRSVGNAVPVHSEFLKDRPIEDLNGRLYVGRVIMGSDSSAVRNRREDAAAAYGAAGAGDETIIVKVPGLFGFDRGYVAEVRPFDRVDGRDIGANPYSNAYSNGQSKLAGRLEEARQQWLKDNNFVGGVRTFVNDAALFNKAPVAATRQTNAVDTRPEPRAVIELAPDMPRFKAKMRVLAPATSLADPQAGTRPVAGVGRVCAPGVTKVLPRGEVSAASASSAAAVKSPRG